MAWMLKQKYLLLSSCLLLSACAHHKTPTPAAAPIPDMPAITADTSGDLYIPGYNREDIAAIETPVADTTTKPQPFTVISPKHYISTMQQADRDVSHLIAITQPQADLNSKLLALAHDPSIVDKPYITVGAEGEGDWYARSPEPATDIHIQQDPVFRTDAHNCQTLANLVLGVLHSDSLDVFRRHTIRQIEYGAADLPSDAIRYFNRNNFTSASFNPINQKNGFLQDVTPNAKTIQTTIDIANWLAKQTQAGIRKNHIRVLHADAGLKMQARFNTHYASDYPVLQAHAVSLTYLPKNLLAHKVDDKYIANTETIQQLPTPALVEIVRDDKNWKIGGKSMQELIGSGLLISHMGFIYRQTFHKSDIIYQKIACHKKDGKKICAVQPVKCHKNQCDNIMLLMATNAYPNHYYWYRQNGNYHCSAVLPQNIHDYTSCNRVLNMPLAAYITQQQYGQHLFMDTPSIIGLHIEKILTCVTHRLSVKYMHSLSS